MFFTAKSTRFLICCISMQGYDFISINYEESKNRSKLNLYISSYINKAITVLIMSTSSLIYEVNKSKVYLKSFVKNSKINSVAVRTETMKFYISILIK